MITKRIKAEDINENDIFVVDGGVTTDGQRMARYARYRVTRLTEDGAFVWGCDYASLDHRHGVTVRWEDLKGLSKIVRK